MKRSTTRPTAMRTVAGSAALALCLSTAAATASSAQTQTARPAAAVSAVPFADVTIEPGSLFAFVGIPAGPVSVGAGEDIVISVPDAVDVSTADANVVDDDGNATPLAVTSDDSSNPKTITITAPADDAGGLVVEITGLDMASVDTVESGFAMTLAGAGPADVTAEIDLTSEAAGTLTIEEDVDNTITLPTLLGEAPRYGVTDDPVVTLKDGADGDIAATADFSAPPETFTLNPDGDGSADLTLTFPDSDVDGWRTVVIKQALTITAAANPDPGTDPDPEPTIDNETWVNAIYSDVLGREPNTIEQTIWVAYLNAEATTPEKIARALADTKDWRADWIQENYEDWLEREGSDRGVDHWQRRMAAGLSPQGVQAEFLASNERFMKSGGTNTRWITGMYLDVLDRTPTAALLDLWNARMDSGWSRSRAAQEFVLHKDHLFPLVEAEYQYMLDEDEIAEKRVNYWVGQLKNKARYEQLVAGLAGTSDYEAKLMN